MILLTGLSFRTAAVDVRERFAVPTEALPGLLAQLAAHPLIAECMVLSTCNRVEVLVELTPIGASEPKSALAAIADVFASALATCKTASVSSGPVSAAAGTAGAGAPPSAAEIAHQFYVHLADDAILHLFRVAASLDSMVVGEPQILGQLKDASDLAQRAGTLRGTLGRCVNKALSVGKRVRHETQLGSGTVSVSSVALELARNIFGDLSASTVLLVGAGEMAEAAARAIGKSAKSIRVCNRSVERAAVLAAQFGGSAAPLSELEDELVLSDVVITSTGATSFIVDRKLCERVLKRRRGRSLFFIDIAVPRNVDPEAHVLDNVYVYNVDDLESQVAQAREARQEEAQAAEVLVREDVQVFLNWQRSLRVQPYVVALRDHVKRALDEELSRSLQGKLRSLGDPEREALGQMLEAATNRVLHIPTSRLKASSADDDHAGMVRTLAHLFDLAPAPNSPHTASSQAPAAGFSEPPGPADAALAPTADAVCAELARFPSRPPHTTH